MSEKEDGDTDGGQNDSHPADPQGSTRSLFRAQKPPSVKTRCSAESVKVCKRSCRHRSTKMAPKLKKMARKFKTFFVGTALKVIEDFLLLALQSYSLESFVQQIDHFSSKDLCNDKRILPSVIK